VSKGTLSALESGTGNPTVETLDALTDTLGVTVGMLVADEGNRPQIMRAEQGEWVEGSAVGLRRVDRLLGRGMIDMYEATFAAGVRRESEGHAPGVLEHLLVTSGRLLVGPVGETTDLDAGDRITFAGDGPHVYEALGDDAQAVLLISYVRPPSPDKELERELEHVLSKGDLVSRRERLRPGKDRRMDEPSPEA
jgi:transcriptional regulator with XRE-family HTH domain